ncbi:MAG: hypothetical protein IPP91_04300 [Betaproteobacteria bacterium]|nr:hypothetical protein [Betaproteobacteria bacterium]
MSRIEKDFLKSFGYVKKAAAMVNRDLKILDAVAVATGLVIASRIF